MSRWRQGSQGRGETQGVPARPGGSGSRGTLPTTEAYPDRGYEVDTPPSLPGGDERLVKESLALPAHLHD